jgi:acyl carrier protein
MDINEIEQTVRKVLAEQFAFDEAKVTVESRFSEDLDADSLDMVEATMALEESLGIRIADEEVQGIKTVGEAVALAATKLGVPA